MSSNLIAGAMLSAWLVSLSAGHLQQTRDSAPVRSVEMASISGIVVTADAAARPLPGVAVTINGPALPIGLSALTDDRGTFTIRGVPAGTVTITTRKAGWIAGAYGASRPGRPGTPVVLAPRTALTITISMARGAVVTGTLRDERGAPLVDVPVLVLDARRALTSQSPSLTSSPGGVTARFTDDQGVFRVFGLVPGEYVIVAMPRGPERPAPAWANLPDAAVDALFAKLERRPPPSPASPAGPVTAPVMVAPVFYPGTARFSDASRVRLEAGEERAGLDFLVTAVPLASVEGQIQSDGIPGSNVQLGLAQTSAPLTGLGGARLSTKIDEDGRFKFADLLPGRYRLTARGNASWTVAPGIGSPGTNPDGTLYGVAEIEVAGIDVSGVDVRLRRGGTIAGRVSVDPPLSSLAAETRLVLTPATSYGPVVTGTSAAALATFQSMYTAPVAATGGTFDFRGVAPGSYRLEVRTTSELTGRWWLRSAMAQGRDLLDAPIEIGLGTTLADVAVTIAQRHTELAGSLQSVTGIPAPEYYVVVFPADRELWTPGSRRIRFTRPASDGTFSFADLPPGAYLLAALADVEPDDWQRVEFLQELVPAAVKVTLGEGEKRRQDLRIAK